MCLNYDFRRAETPNAIIPNAANAIDAGSGTGSTERSKLVIFPDRLDVLLVVRAKPMAAMF